MKLRDCIVCYNNISAKYNSKNKDKIAQYRAEYRAKKKKELAQQHAD